MAFLERAGARIAYDVHGSGPGTPLLLSHGYSLSAAMWTANLPALAADRPVITWDVRGHGASSSPTDPGAYSRAEAVADMLAILDACGVERAAVGGLSLGGYLSLAFEQAHPERVAALVLCDTGPGFRKDAAREEWNAQAFATAAALDRDGLAALQVSADAAGPRRDPAGLALAARGLLAHHDGQVIEGLPAVAVPTLVVVGAFDGPFLGAADYLAAKIPGAVKVVIPGAGHVSNIDVPRAFDAAVGGFLHGVDG